MQTLMEELHAYVTRGGKIERIPSVNLEEIAYGEIKHYYSGDKLMQLAIKARVSTFPLYQIRKQKDSQSNLKRSTLVKIVKGLYQIYLDELRS